VGQLLGGSTGMTGARDCVLTAAATGLCSSICDTGTLNCDIYHAEGLITVLGIWVPSPLGIAAHACSTSRFVSAWHEFGISTTPPLMPDSLVCLLPCR
jgi:hypothetical protein